MSGLEDDFTKKAGPLPVWAWGIVGAGGILLFQHLRKGKAVAATTVDTGVVADPSAEGSGITPAYDASYGSVLADSSYGSAGGQSIPVPLSPGQFDTMLQDYLQGHGYTQSEINAATPTTVDLPTVNDTALPATTGSGAPSPVLAPTNTGVATPVDTIIPPTAPVSNVFYPDPVYSTPSAPGVNVAGTPIPVPAALSAAIQQVGGGIPQANRTNVGAVRGFTTFDPNSQAQLRAGGTVVGGNGLVYKMIIGSDGTPHATSIGAVGQVI